MKALINRLEKTPISVSELQRVVPSHTKVISYDQLKPTLDANFEKDKPNVILLIEGEDRIGHFVLLTKEQKGLRLFNSYGFSPEKTIRMMRADRKLLDILPAQYERNKYRYQKLNNNTSTCGLWTLARAILYDLDERGFKDLFRRRINLGTPDDIITALTLLFRHLMQ